MKKLVTLLLTIVFLSVFVVGAQIFLFMGRPISSLGIKRTSESADQAIVVEIHPGDTFTGVLTDLEKRGFLSQAWLFKLYGRLRPAMAKVKVGEYDLNGKMTPAQLMETLSSGKSRLYSITFPEGINRYEIAELLESKKMGRRDVFLKLTENRDVVGNLLDGFSAAAEGASDFGQPTLEGFLFPDTYQFTKFSGEKEIVRSMVMRFLAEYHSLSQQIPLNPGLTPFKAVVLASMIEKETGAPQERPLIASVFFNRIKKKMKLQSDPTTMYGLLVKTGQPISNITRTDLLTPTPYNTYTVASLPIGPIGNPGAEALKAVFQPDTTEYFYFVSRNDGTHVFSKTFAEHNKAVRAFQLDPTAREGKSWRDLNRTAR